MLLIHFPRPDFPRSLALGCHHTYCTYIYSIREEPPSYRLRMTMLGQNANAMYTFPQPAALTAASDTLYIKKGKQKKRFPLPSKFHGNQSSILCGSTCQSDQYGGLPLFIIFLHRMSQRTESYHRQEVQH